MVIRSLEKNSWKPSLLLPDMTDTSVKPDESTKKAYTQKYNFFGHLDCQSFSLIRPLEGLGHRPVVILDESKNPGLQVLNRGEGAACEEFADQDAEPDFDLVEPGTVFWRIMKDNLVGRIAQKGCSAGHGALRRRMHGFVRTHLHFPLDHVVVRLDGQYPRVVQRRS